MIMILRAPRGHTSIYLSEHLKSNWLDFNKFMIAKGFSSFNQYCNTCISNDFNMNFASLMNQKIILPDKKIDFYNDNLKITKDKLILYSNGELLDLLELISEKRDSIMRDAKRRGIKY